MMRIADSPHEFHHGRAGMCSPKERRTGNTRSAMLPDVDSPTDPPHQVQRQFPN
jgi:hypothetical protein